MPQASDVLQEKIEKYFPGNGLNTEAPVQFLRASGYLLNMDWTWSRHDVSDYTDMTQMEYDCLAFLAYEWDYGGLRVAKKESE